MRCWKRIIASGSIWDSLWRSISPCSYCWYWPLHCCNYFLTKLFMKLCRSGWAKLRPKLLTDKAHTF